jgi:hypothetical protein
MSSGCGQRAAAVAEDGGAPDAERSQGTDRRTALEARATVDAAHHPTMSFDARVAPRFDAPPPTWDSSVSPPLPDYMAPAYMAPINPRRSTDAR